MHGRSLLAYFGVNITREGSGCGSCSGVLYPRQRALRSTTIASQPPVSGTAVVGFDAFSHKNHNRISLLSIRKRCFLPYSTEISIEVLSAKGEYKQRVTYSVFLYSNDFHLPVPPLSRFSTTPPYCPLPSSVQSCVTFYLDLDPRLPH